VGQASFASKTPSLSLRLRFRAPREKRATSGPQKVDSVALLWPECGRVVAPFLSGAL